MLANFIGLNAVLKGEEELLVEFCCIVSASKVVCNLTGAHIT